jgi:hypothetical protein
MSADKSEKNVISSDVAIERLSGKKDKQQFKKENIAKSYTQASPPTRLGTGLCNDASDSVSQCFPSVNLSRGIRESIFNGNI